VTVPSGATAQGCRSITSGAWAVVILLLWLIVFLLASENLFEVNKIRYESSNLRFTEYLKLGYA
jgi:hypothetical protein